MLQVYNSDIVHLWQLMNRFKEEVVKSQSASHGDTLPSDLVRWHSYLDSLDTLRSWVLSQPLLDTPETHPTLINLPEEYVAPQIENESCNALAKMLTTGMGELANSQSARLGTGLNRHDSARQESYVLKMRSFLTDYVENVEPLDLPESTPRVDQVPAGKTGV